MVFKCKICGGSLDVKQGEKIAVCEYCGVKQTIPSFIEPKIEEIYNRANSYLMHNEFDKAENLYNQILFDNKQDADAYWNILMCRYGVTYVKDPSSGKYIPTCNRTLYTPIYNDENYKNAIKYADEAQKILFEQNAKTIDEIQKGILSISKNEKPFDIFISYKETDSNGIRTQDSVVAQELYNDLTSEGYKVFFARITLEDKVGSEYEPYIYAALASSKIMITICSSKEYIEATWVKNEWARYLSFVAKDSDKTLIPLYYNMEQAELPDEFANLNSYNMKENGFKQELLRGIKKLIPLPIMLLEQRKKRQKTLKKIGLVAVACAIISVIVSIPWFAKLPDYNAAMQLYYDKNYPEATWAFDELGSYRNSKEMKEKAESSWRNSQTTIRTYSLGNGSTAYYVNANGTVDTFDYAPGTMHQQYDINEHGKITSIEMQGNLVALYEDGFVETYPELLSDKSPVEQNNIIKTSPNFECGIVSLKNDGSVIVDIDSDASDSWLSPIRNWKDIISMDFHISSSASSGVVHEGIVLGIDRNFNLKLEMHDFMRFGRESSFNTTILNNFKNICKVDADLDGENINIVALTNDGNLLADIKGNFTSYKLDGAIDVELVECYNTNTYETYYDIYVLYADGKVYKHDRNNYILSDVIYMDRELLVTRSGSIYLLADDGIMPTEGKTRVHNEWLERMN